MGSKWDQTSTALLLACVDWCVASDNELDLKTEVPRLMAAQDAERSWKSITAKLASLNRLFAGPDKRDVKVHGSGALALGQAMNLEIAAARQSIEAAETADEVDRQSAATATERGGETGAKSAPRKRSREDDGQENSESSPRKLRKTAAARHEEMDRLAEPERNEASEPEKSVGEPSTDEIPVSSCFARYHSSRRATLTNRNSRLLAPLLVPALGAKRNRFSLGSKERSRR